MTNGYEEAKAGRNILERLGEKIPGYRGFQDRELRRDVDRLQREYLSSELGRLKGVLRDKARSYTDAGKIGALTGFDRLDRPAGLEPGETAVDQADRADARPGTVPGDLERLRRRDDRPDPCIGVGELRPVEPRLGLDA